MESASVEGIKTLRSLALSVRNDQDYGHTTNPRDAVGALINDATNEQAKEILDRYRPPYWNVPGQQPLLLRDGLNKVAHPDPSGYGFFADEHSHDLILSGRLRGKNWIAILSLLDLSKVLMKIPDKELDKSDEEWID
jgi:hypothetical protein